MTDRPDCPNCGHVIPADAPAGELCPKCLLKQVLRSFEKDPAERLRNTSDANE